MDDKVVFWLVISWEEIFDRNDFGHHYAMKLCFAASIGTATIIIGLFTSIMWGLDTRDNLVLIGCWFSLYLITGIIFFFSESGDNCEPMWQNNGAW
jgi:uncharacterized membrane protein